MKIRPGDELEITFIGAPEVNTTQKVRRDGRIALKLIGEIIAADKTPSLLREELARVYGNQLQIKEVSILVRSPAPVFVSGEIRSPGEITMDRPMTALEAIMKTGGFTNYAQIKSVVVIRHDAGKRFGHTINYKDMLKGDAGHPFYLQPFDIVYVPRTPITKVNQWVDQHINRMLPSLGLGYTSEGELIFRR